MPFYNFSNHPSAQWPAEQKAAARELCGDDQIIDVPPGEVPPEWDRSAVVTRAWAILEAVGLAVREEVVGCRTGRLIGDGGAVVMVATESTLNHVLVSILTDEGGPYYRTVAATTKRESVEEVQPDGSVRKTNVFKFVRFREY